MKYEGIPTWTSTTKYVDIDTGEEITKHKYEKEYYHITTNTHITFINKGHGHKYNTKIGRRKPKQTTIF